MSNAETPPAVAKEVWRDLGLELNAIARQEPALAGYLKRLTSPRQSPQQVLALRLAQGLAHPDMRADHASAILMEALHSRPSIANAAAQDLVAIRSNDPASRTYAHAFLNYGGFHAVQVARMAHAFWHDSRVDLAAWLSNRASVAFGPDIHPAAQLGTGIMLDHGAGIVVGETAVVEDDVTILQNVTLGGTGKIRGDRHPKVRRGVMIGVGANILGNIEIGAFSKIAAGSVVLKDVPARCTVAGVPARIVRLHQATEFTADRRQPSRVC